MGQYYKPANIDKMEYIYTHNVESRVRDYRGKFFKIGEGLKLMEHSYIGNKLMNGVERLIMPGGDWYKNRLVWAGDYADEETDRDCNLYTIMEEEGEEINLVNTKKRPKDYKFLVNYTLKEFVDLSTIKEDEDGFKIHPLSLLVCEGNGRGGGDYLYGYDEDKGKVKEERVGSWARCEIGLEKEVKEGFEEINGQFKDNY